MTRKTEAFFDALAAHYHLVYRDWGDAVGRHGRIVDSLIRAEIGDPGDRPRRVLDAACGIGTQSLGLAQLGYVVCGGDLSAASIRCAKAWAQELGLSPEFRVVDMREVDKVFSGTFDAAIAMDNALPHLDPRTELSPALAALRRSLSPGGVLLASLRDYDKLAREKPPGLSTRTIEEVGSRREVDQVWRWWPDGRGYDFTLNLRHFPHKGKARRFSYHGSLFVLRRKDLAGALQSLGFRRIRWHEPEDTGFHQPIVSARRP
jgi:SAM-dependent methyltransferase